MSKKITYAEAIGELETIVAELEDSGMDIDLLAGKVKRASFLLRHCRERLRSTEEEVRKVLDEMETDPSDDSES